MATIAKLRLNDQEMTVLKCDSDFHQNVDHHARINSDVMGGVIHLVVEASDNIDIQAWGMSKDMTRDGEITFQRSETANTMRKITFKNAYCINLRESYSALGEEMMVVKFTIAAETVMFDQITFQNRW